MVASVEETLSCLVHCWAILLHSGGSSARRDQYDNHLQTYSQKSLPQFRLMDPHSQAKEYY